MIVQKGHIISALFIFFLSLQPLLSQSYSSRDNYTGAWENPSSWNPLWPMPLTNLNGNNITIYGYITENGSLFFKGTANKLTVNDTLVIKGNFVLDNNNDLIINDNGILVVLGDFTVNNQTVVTANGYLIVIGNFTKYSAQGSLLSNDNPVRVFIGGTITPVELTDNNPAFPALNCTTPATTRYPSSNCSYGNLTDIISDPVYPFLQTICMVQIPTITASGPATFCEGESVTLTSSPGSSYLWSTGATTQSINITISGSYTVKITNTNGCLSAESVPVEVIVYKYPVAFAGPDQELNFVFETRMEAVLSAGETGEWFLVSGSGNIIDKNSPVTMITELSIGENKFLWKMQSNNCESAAEVRIIVHDLVIPSVITPDGDGKNDYFKISLNADKVELIIFNRWGNEEYSNTDYLNDWDGRNNKGAELPADTYFYVIKYGNRKIFKGSVLIKR